LQTSPNKKYENDFDYDGFTRDDDDITTNVINTDEKEVLFSLSDFELM